MLKTGLEIVFLREIHICRRADKFQIYRRRGHFNFGEAFFHTLGRKRSSVSGSHRSLVTVCYGRKELPPDNCHGLESA